MSLSWDADKIIDDWLKSQHQDNDESDWTEPFVVSCSRTKNPFYSDYANSFKQLPSYEENWIVDLYTNQTFEMKFTDCSVTKFTPIPPRPITFLSDCRLNSAILMTKTVACPILQSYWTGKKINVIENPINLGAAIQRKTSSYFEFTVSEFLSNQDLFEPLLFTGFMFSGQQIVSEPWNFVPLPCAEILRVSDTKVLENTKIVYRLNEVSDRLSLVIIAYHPYSQKNGTTVLSAYEKNSTSIEEAQATINKSKNSNINNYCQLGYYIVSLPTLLENDLLPPPFISSETVTEKMLQSIVQGGIKYPAEDKLGLTIKIKISAREIDDSTVIQSNNLLGSMNYSITEPILNFSHSLLVEMTSATVKLPNWKTEAVYVTVELKKDLESDGMPLIKDRFSQKHVDCAKGIACPAHKKVAFRETFIIDLPQRVENGSIVVFTFVAISRKGDKFVEEKIGYSYIHLMDKHGEQVALKGGKFELAINEINSNNPQSLRNGSSLFCKIMTTRRSNLLPKSPELIRVYKSIQNKSFILEEFRKVEPKALLRSSLQIFDILISNFTEAPKDIFDILLYIADIATDLCPKAFDKFLDVFSVVFSFMKNGNSTHDFHVSLLTTWEHFIHKEHEACKNGIGRDAPLMNFFFVLLIKSIYITKDRDFHQEINMFIDAFTKSIVVLNKSNHQLSIQSLKTFSLFVLNLFDIGFYTAAIDSIEAQVKAFGDTKIDLKSSLFILKSSLQPKVIATALLHIKHFPEFLIDQIERCLVAQNFTELDKIFSILNYNIACLPTSISMAVCTHILPILDFVPSLVLGNTANEESPYVTTFIYIVGIVDPDHIRQYIRTAESKSSFFKAIMKSLDFLSYSGKANDSQQNRFSHMHCKTEKELLYKKSFSLFRERAFSAQTNVIRFMGKFIFEEGYVEECSLIIYQLFSSNLVINLVEDLVLLLVEFIKLYPKEIFENKKVPLAKFIMKILELSRFTESGNIFFDTLEQVDKATYGSTNRSLMLVERVIYKLPLFVVTEIVLNQCFARTIIFKYQKLLKMQDNYHNNIELLAEVIYNKLLLFQHSPDVVCEILQEIASTSALYGYYLEFVMCNIAMLAVVFEYNTLLGRIDKIFGCDSQAIALTHICPFAKALKCPDNILKDLPDVPGFCDSKYFHFPVIIDCIIKMINYSQEKEYHEITIDLIGIVIPFMQYNSDYSFMSQTLGNISNSAVAVAGIAKDQERLLGKYYRVNFFGDVFKDDDKKSYIYREKELTNVFNFSKRIIQDLTNVHPGKKFEIIQESSKVDESKLNSGIGYIQITSVDPYITKEERKLRTSQFEEKMNNKLFYFDTPYVIGSNEAQGPIDKQCRRRAIFELEHPMPYILKRQQIISFSTKEYNPAKVSLRMIKDRTYEMVSLIETKNTSGIQQMLNGNLLVQVNVGPKRIAEVFLGGQAEIDEKTSLKLKKAFADFLEINQKALKIHAEYIRQNPMFISMQQELESGFEALKELISKYIV
ncbi:Dedicator of cytokinesis family protein [Trichomonas vaginalis G3]|uniref:Dedicator of cytokinesis family protein n=1 Tax=Trichomonas vaginalis (strain ATCC PRA-98 / G3) TaxID=412133 RepID=A2FYZ3_TRIV3|nr:dedicator of cytokinesis DOCK family [Trichomonas vaginalis G3]EAX89875.1 Dedicator of cytokinesis family protein [Trichomonas vaginalis G3]KAI5515314.1 dedicator of cytokinesis DOCK family [Trichomonas vaginalis G3]|eukprot:XP_001302805.1 Dedicator of cytokinesis family protein [Trichomonas vaginalis G3]